LKGSFFDLVPLEVVWIRRVVVEIARYAQCPAAVEKGHSDAVVVKAIAFVQQFLTDGAWPID